MRRKLLVALGCAAAVYAMVYVDLVLRARSAYLEGMKYLEWEQKPELKKAWFDGRLAKRETELKADAAAGKLSAPELEDKLELARFEHDERIAESNFKYAYVWFQTAVELFSPPESKWVVLSRAKMPEAKALWKAELDAKRIPYKDYMLD